MIASQTNQTNRSSANKTGMGTASAKPRPSLPQQNKKAEQSIVAKLTKIDWNFHGEVTNTATHGFHPYPARFIPQIPATLIHLFTKPHEMVYDPFVGGGTTCVEANIAGRDALGGDVNRLAVMITQVKTQPLSEAATIPILQTARLIPKEAKNINRAIPKLSVDWFEDFVAAELVAIKDKIMSLSDIEMRKFCLVALSAIIVRVSRQDSDTRYSRVAKKLSAGDTIYYYEQQLKKMLRLMSASRTDLSRGSCCARVADSRNSGTFADDSADFIITSPPYPNAYDYHLYHRHRLLWLDMDPAELKRQEIGAHAHYSRKNGLNENDFSQDMEKVFCASARILKHRKYLAMVIGDSILHGRHIHNREIVKAAAKVAGFSPVADFRRQIDSRKKSFNPKHGNICTEDIVILRNDRG